MQDTKHFILPAHNDCTHLGTILQQKKLEKTSYQTYQSFEKEIFHLHTQLLPTLYISTIGFTSF